MAMEYTNEPLSPSENRNRSFWTWAFTLVLGCILQGCWFTVDKDGAVLEAFTTAGLITFFGIPFSLPAIPLLLVSNKLIDRIKEPVAKFFAGILCLAMVNAVVLGFAGLLFGELSMDIIQFTGGYMLASFPIYIAINQLLHVPVALEPDPEPET